MVTAAVVTAAVVTEAGTSTADGAAGATSEGVAATGAFPLECVRNLRRFYELLAAHKKVLVRHGSYLLVDVVGVCRERPLPPAAQCELLPGIHALLGMCTPTRPSTPRVTLAASASSRTCSSRTSTPSSTRARPEAQFERK